MIKHILLLILLSVLIIMTMVYAQTGLHALLAAHDWIGNTLKEVFADGKVGDITRQLIALLSVPLLVGLIPAFLYWLVKRRAFPYFMNFVWVTWLVQTSALVALAKLGA